MASQSKRGTPALFCSWEPALPATTPDAAATAAPTWRVPRGQSLVFEELDDGVMLFDALVGGTHLVNVTAAEMLALIDECPGLTTAEVRERLVSRLGVPDEALPLNAVEDLLQWLARLNIVAAQAP